jgi:hypothetical protein
MTPYKESEIRRMVVLLELQKVAAEQEKKLARYESALILILAGDGKPMETASKALLG